MCDQIGVAVDNINLFEAVSDKSTELESSNRNSREALEQQTATSEVLRVIASSPTELQPVLDTLIANAVKLSGATRGSCPAIEGEFYRVVAHYGESPEMIATYVPIPYQPARTCRFGRAFSVANRCIFWMFKRNRNASSFSRQTGYERCWLHRCCEKERQLAAHHMARFCRTVYGTADRAG